MPKNWAIDAMRGLAALLVLLSHSDSYRIIPIQWAPDLKILAGETGVDLFFILSGYLIWTSAGRTLNQPGGLRVYAIHRLTRIMPLYYLALAAAIFAAPLFIGSWKPEPTENGLLRHLVFSQSFAPSVSREINPVLWTLTHEALFYAVVPFRWFVRSALWTFLPVSIALAIGAHETGFGAIAPFLQVAFLFAVGFTIAHYKLQLDWRAALVAMMATFLLWGREWQLLAPICAFALFTALAALPARRFFEIALKPLSLFGVISYSVYIWHYLAVEIYGPQIINHQTWLFRISWLYTSLFLVAVIGCSTLSYLLVEKPAMTKLRDILLDFGKPARALRPREGA